MTSINTDLETAFRELLSAVSENIGKIHLGRFDLTEMEILVTLQVQLGGILDSLDVDDKYVARIPDCKIQDLRRTTKNIRERCEKPALSASLNGGSPVSSAERGGEDGN